MMFQRINEIVCCTDHIDIGFSDEISHVEIFSSDDRIGFVPDHLRIFLVYGIFYPEVHLQFQMGPVIQRISYGVGNGFTESLEFFEIGLGPCDVFFTESHASHGSPLVVVSAQPDVSDVSESRIFSDHLGIQMTMIVIDWHVFRILMVQLLPYFIL